MSPVNVSFRRISINAGLVVWSYGLASESRTVIFA